MARMNEPQSSRMAMKSRFIALLASVGGVALVLAESAVGPNYHRPLIDSPANFRNAPAAASTNSLADLQWWELYHDATLSLLIHTALTKNYDLRIAVARVERARAIAAQGKA